jgi:hypothetical protein
MKTLTQAIKNSRILFTSILLIALLCIPLVRKLYAQAAPTFSLDLNAGSSTTLQEGAPLDGSSPGMTFFLVHYSPQPPSGTDVTLNLTSGCQFASGGIDPFHKTGSSNTGPASASGWGIGVTSDDDNVYQGVHSCILSGTLTSSDSAYNGLKAAPVVITILDNEVAPTPAPTSTPTTTQKPKVNTAPKPTAATTSTPPTPISIDTVKINDNKVSSEDGLVTYDFKQPIILSGKTIANGQVTLYIYSEPRMAVIKANTNGDWSYTISDLEPGDHRIEAETKDPTTGLTSSRTELVKFAVKQAAATATPKTTNQTVPQVSKKGNFNLLFLALPVIILGGLAVFIMLKRRRRSKAT